jgi:hypothetical protein
MDVLQIKSDNTKAEQIQSSSSMFRFDIKIFPLTSLATYRSHTASFFCVSRMG